MEGLGLFGKGSQGGLSHGAVSFGAVVGVRQSRQGATKGRKGKETK